MTQGRAIGTGLRENPFAAGRFVPGRIPWFDEEPGELARLLARATAPGARHQLLGGHGTGKSTLLAHLEEQGRRAGAYVVRLRGSRRLPWRPLLALARAPGPGLLLVDEAEEVGRARGLVLWLAARMAKAAVVVSAHRDRGWPTLAVRRVDPAAAHFVIEHLAPGAAHSRDELEARIARHGGNLREVLFELYDEHEARPRDAAGA